LRRTCRCAPVRCSTWGTSRDAHASSTICVLCRSHSSRRR
jgi:hypothetical protein